MLESEAIIAWALGAHADPRVRTTPSTPRVIFDHKHFPTIVGLGTRAHARCRRNLACSKVGKKKEVDGCSSSHEFMWTCCWSFPCLAVSAIIVAESFPSSSAGVLGCLSLAFSFQSPSQHHSDGLAPLLRSRWRP